MARTLTELEQAGNCTKCGQFSQYRNTGGQCSDCHNKAYYENKAASKAAKITQAADFNKAATKAGFKLGQSVSYYALGWFGMGGETYTGVVITGRDGRLSAKLDKADGAGRKVIPLNKSFTIIK